MESLRVNFNNGAPAIVPPDDLQSKGGSTISRTHFSYLREKYLCRHSTSISSMGKSNNRSNP